MKYNKTELPNGKPSAKLTVEQVIEIKKRIKAGEKSVSIAADYGVTEPAIHRIRTGWSWRDVKISEA